MVIHFFQYNYNDANRTRGSDIHINDYKKVNKTNSLSKRYINQGQCCSVGNQTTEGKRHATGMSMVSFQQPQFGFCITGGVTVTDGNLLVR